MKMEKMPVSVSSQCLVDRFGENSGCSDRLLIRDLVFKFKTKEKALLIHSSFGGTVRDTRFVTKRLSSLFSEAIVYIYAFSADQRKLGQRDAAGKLILNIKHIEQLLAPLQLIILGPVISDSAGTSVLADGEELLKAARAQMEFSELILFPGNGLSPLGSKAKNIEGKDEYEELLKVFEEEKETLDRALVHAPARIVSPKYLSNDP